LSKICTKALLAVSLCAVPCAAQAKSAGPKPQLKMVVILSRHGLRSPTWTQARLDSYSAIPWPKWSVPPGNLTVRGHQLMKQFGGFDRGSLAREGLFAERGCADAAATYIWADSDQRTIESGQALAEGLFPDCMLPVHGHAEGENDPLFHPAANGVKPAEADAAFAELNARMKQPADARQGQLIEEVNHLLLGCSLRAVCASAHTPKMPLISGPIVAVRGNGDHTVDLQGPLAQASSFAEDFLLEYADGMPMEHVGWGKVDAAELGKLLTLHSDYFDLMHRTPALAKIEASNMLFHIEKTLEQHVEDRPIADAIGPVDSKLVMLVGHDTNLAGIAALLGVHWDLDGRHDDTPPGAELALELWQDEHGVYTVRVTVAMQTLQQLRKMPELTRAAPPARETLTLPGCAATGDRCAWNDFQKVADRAMDRNDVFPMQKN